MNPTQLASYHADILHVLAWDYYGTRLATASADHRIAVLDKHPESPSLVLNDLWHAHDSAISRLHWAHPSFGRVLVSSAMDASIIIWEEAEHEPRGSGKRWKERGRLVDARGRVMGMALAPEWHGLVLASVAEDGVVRIYEASRSVMHWGILQEFEVKSTQQQRQQQQQHGDDARTVYDVAWCRSKFTPATLAVAFSPPGSVRLYRKDRSSRFVPSETIRCPTPCVIHSIDWAPNLGRAHHLLAAGCSNNRVLIWRLTTESPSPSKDGTIGAEEEVRWHAVLVGDFGGHSAEVRRVNWNVTGTILASSGDDGAMRLWRQGARGVWQAAGKVHLET